MITLILAMMMRAPVWDSLGDVHIYHVSGQPPIGSYSYFPPHHVYEARCGIDLMHGVDFATGSEARRYVEACPSNQR